MLRFATMSSTSKFPRGNETSSQGYDPPRMAATTARAQSSDSTRLLGPEALKIGAATPPV